MKSIQLEDHEALVLFDFLHREIEVNKEARLAPLFAHPAEFWALNTLLSRLESQVSEPFRQGYAALVESARATIVEECDPDRTYRIGGRG